MSQTLKQTLDEYRHQFKSDTASADKSLFADVKRVLHERLQARVLDSEAVHVAVDLSNYFGEDRKLTVKTLSRYLTQPLPQDEEAWARWRLVDNLAALGRCSEVVATQQQFLDWARQVLPPDQLLWVMYDSTQALSWVEAGKENTWLQVFQNLMGQVSATPENRRNRFIYLETASVVLNSLRRVSEVLQIAQLIRQLSEEDTSWDRSLEAKLISFATAINAHCAMQEMEEARRSAEIASKLLEEQWQNLSAMTSSEKQKLLIMYHNMGGTLYLTRQYELAVPFLRRAVELNSFVEHTYLWLSASLWATTKERPEVLALLKQGAQRAVGNQGLGSVGYDKWMNLPEFQDVINDDGFLDAVK
jgi:tetratricopeptide (TPR) repeat protein